MPSVGPSPDPGEQPPSMPGGAAHGATWEILGNAHRAKATGNTAADPESGGEGLGS